MKVNILNIMVDQMSLDGVIEQISQWLHLLSQHYIVTVNPEFVVAAQKNREFKNILNGADLAICDGFGLVLAGKFLAGKKLTRVAGVDLVSKLLNCQIVKLSNNSKFNPPAGGQNLKLYLLGGQEGIAKAVAEKFPKADIVGAEAGGKVDKQSYLLDNNEAVINRIKASGANILLVAFGQVKQEMWIAKNLSKMDNIRVAIGVGGTFDYLSGKVKRAPKWLRAFGFEWLYRLIREPKRIKRIWNATAVFGWLAMKQK